MAKKKIKLLHAIVSRADYPYTDSWKNIEIDFRIVDILSTSDRAPIHYLIRFNSIADCERFKKLCVKRPVMNPRQWMVKLGPWPDIQCAQVLEPAEIIKNVMKEEERNTPAIYKQLSFFD